MNPTQQNAITPLSYLETPRLILRTPRLEDAFELSELAQRDSTFAKNAIGNGNHTLELSCTAIIRMLNEERSNRGKWWLVQEQESGALIGLTGYSSRHPEQGILSALASSHFGQGVTKEILDAIGALSQTALCSA